MQSAAWAAQEPGVGGVALALLLGVLDHAAAIGAGVGHDDPELHQQIHRIGCPTWSLGEKFGRAAELSAVAARQTGAMRAAEREAELIALVAAAAPTLVWVQESGPDLGVRPRAAEANADRLLVERAREGDEDAFAVLVNRYGQPILSLCYASTLDAAEAEDLSQEVFVSVWRNLRRFRGESAFSTWLFALARNACVDRARRSRNRPQVGLPEGLADARAAGGSSEQATLEAIFVAARALSVPLRQALFLRDLQGHSYEEIARIQGVPIGTVRSRIAAARSAIAQEMGG